MYFRAPAADNATVARTACLLLLLSATLAGAGGGERVVESVLPALHYGASCWSSVDLQNLGDRIVTAEIEGHRSSGSLAPLAGQPGVKVRLGPGEKVSFRLQIEEDTTGAWAKIREQVPAQRLSPVIAVGGVTECVAGNELHTAAREAAYPTRNPWFNADVDEALRGSLISLINTSERTAQASVCYSAGSLYSVPKDGRAPELIPVCSGKVDVQVPPFGSRQFAIDREGNTHFSLKTRGDAIVLQMLHPLDPRVKLYTVNSTITFGSEEPLI
jgi:hypothetical protein